MRVQQSQHQPRSLSGNKVTRDHDLYVAFVFLSFRNVSVFSLTAVVDAAVEKWGNLLMWKIWRPHTGAFYKS